MLWMLAVGGNAPITTRTYEGLRADASQAAARRPHAGRKGKGKERLLGA
jgi:hypothetical protein